MPEIPVAKIDVKLSESEQVKVFNNFTLKDIYASILTAKDLWTTNQLDYQNSITNFGKDTQKSNENTPKVPKYLVNPFNIFDDPSITVIGNCIIASPIAPYFNPFSATLKKSDGDQFYDTVEGSYNSWGGASEGSASTRIAGRTGNTMGQQADSGGVGVAGGGTAANIATISSSKAGRPTAFDNSWDDPSDLFEERRDGIYTTRKDVLEKEIVSAFLLQKNQPFAIQFKLFDYAPEQAVVLSSNQENNANALTRTPSLEVVWGGNHKITINQQGLIEFFYRGKKIDKSLTLPLTSGDRTNGPIVSFYPMGNFLFVYNGVPTTEATVNKWFVAFNVKEAINLEGGPLTLVFKCGEGHFNFSPIVHPSDGKITSPLFSAGYIPDRIVTTCSYIGKFGVGARDNPISFPDKNDKDGLYSYLNGYCGIIHDIVQVSGPVYSYTMTLKVAKNGGVFDLLNDDIQKALINTQKMAAQEFLALKNGQQTMAQSQANMITHIENAFSNPLANAHAADGQIWNDGFINHTLDSSAANTFGTGSSIFKISSGPAEGAVNAVKHNLQSITNTFFGASAGDPSSGILGGDLSKTSTALNFGGQMADQLAKAGKNASKNMKDLKLKTIGFNIYSPAVFLTQITFVKDLVTVNFNPNPQIDNCDVSDVTVQQAVEHSSATVVLNNRDVCPGQRGKYTFAPGTNNFTGIKPIEIKLGYQGGTDANALHTVFKGYVSKRRYVRSGSSQSQCILECEDRSKKFKEQFAVNLPFFDGWCHLGAIYYLAKEAGFSDDEILLYQDPVSGRKQRIRDLIQGNPDTFTGGCFDGHVNENPPGVAGFDGAYLHATLPLVLLGSHENVNYNFSFGTALWTCMMRIREFLNWYMYCNNFGNLIYGPPPAIVTDSGVTFKEVDKVGDFNEIQKRLEVDFDTAYTRNMVYLQGQKFVPNKDVFGGGTWVPHVHIKRKPNFPNDIGDTSYAPWIRYAFIRNPKFEDDQLAAFAANEYFRRYTRLLANCEFSAWGHPALFPFMGVTIDESILNETGANAISKFTIAAHTLHASASDFKLTSDFSVETYDPKSVNYEPNLHHLRE